MAYNKFSIEKVQADFGVVIQTVTNLFGTSAVQNITPSPLLKDTLANNTHLALAINTKKARSEFIVAPILMELYRYFSTKQKISLFSGVELTADKERGLNGRCDFIISLDQEQLLLTSPIITLVEAKKDNVANGFGQCIAEMIGAQLFNQQKNKPLDTIYGVVTTGSNWKFLKLNQNVISILAGEIYIDQIEVILGTLATMIENK